MVDIVVRVLVFYLCPSSVRVLSTFPCTENRKTYFTFHNFLSEVVPLMRKCGKYFTAVQDEDSNMTHARFVLDDRGYKHSLRICDILCFDTTTIIAGKRLTVAIYCITNIVFTECLSVTNLCCTVSVHTVIRQAAVSMC